MRTTQGVERSEREIQKLAYIFVKVDGRVWWAVVNAVMNLRGSKIRGIC